MTSYIIRRLLLMIPTLLGITFMVFMLIALSPGGVGVALKASGGQMEATSRAQLEAYLEDRYGLDDPVVLQYLRWLGRVSPLKFGGRDQRDPTGEIIRSPKPLKPPALLGSWYAVGESVEPPPADEPVHIGETQEQKTAAYRQAANQYAQDRAAFLTKRTELEAALRDYARQAGLRGAVDGDNDPVISRFEAIGPDKSLAAWAAIQAAGAEVTQAYRAALASRRQLERVFQAKPFPEVGFWLIPGAMSAGPPDFGMSFSRTRPVIDLIATALPVTLLINFIAFPIIYMIAIPTGMLAASRRGTIFDTGTGAALVALWSIPVVWAGVLALGFLAKKEYLGWFPAAGLQDQAVDTFAFLPGFDANGQFQRGFILDRLWHICLPVACLVYGGCAVLSKQTRAAMLDNFNADYVRTAKAKGVPRKDVIFRHVFRNSLLPLITMFASLFPLMLAGSVVIEKIFTIPGMGSMVIEAITLRDRELLLGNTLMISAVNLLALLLADILYAVADPRISYS